MILIHLHIQNCTNYSPEFVQWFSEYKSTRVCNYNKSIIKKKKKQNKRIIVYAKIFDKWRKRIKKSYWGQTKSSFVLIVYTIIWYTSKLTRDIFFFFLEHSDIVIINKFHSRSNNRSFRRFPPCLLKNYHKSFFLIKKEKQFEIINAKSNIFSSFI